MTFYTIDMSTYLHNRNQSFIVSFAHSRDVKINWDPPNFTNKNVGIPERNFQNNKFDFY